MQCVIDCKSTFFARFLQLFAAKNVATARRKCGTILGVRRCVRPPSARRIGASRKHVPFTLFLLLSRAVVPENIVRESFSPPAASQKARRITEFFLGLAKFFLSLAKFFLSTAKFFLSVAKFFLGVAKFIFPRTPNIFCQHRPPPPRPLPRKTRRTGRERTFAVGPARGQISRRKPQRFAPQSPIPQDK